MVLIWVHISVGFPLVISSIIRFLSYDPSEPTTVFASGRTRKLFSRNTLNLFFVLSLNLDNGVW